MKKDPFLSTAVLHSFPKFSKVFYMNLTIKTIANYSLFSCKESKPPISIFSLYLITTILHRKANPNPSVVTITSSRYFPPAFFRIPSWYCKKFQINFNKKKKKISTFLLFYNACIPLFYTSFPVPIFSCI